MTEGVYRSTSHIEGKDPYILSLDVGTTTLRCYVYDKTAGVKGYSCCQVELLHPQPGWVEMDPDVLWDSVQTVIKHAIQDAGLHGSDITCMGLTTQRNTFITWDKDSGVPFHRFITWQDLRACDLVKTWNKSFTMRTFNTGASFLHTITRQKRFLAGAVLRFQSTQVGMRLLWVVENNFEMRKKLEAKKVRYGDIGTWLLWKLSGGKSYACDYSIASATALYDPFMMEWSNIVPNILGIPLHIFPPVKDSSGFFGNCQEDLFGAAIPITAMIADQQGATFGQCCFDVGDVCCSLGTGTFIDMNTGQKPHASVAGLYPLIGWKYGSECTYLAEGLASDTGLCVDWAKNMGFFDDVGDTASLAESVPDTGGVYFVPAFSGLQAPINDDRASTTMIGITPETTKAHIVRAILESLAFRCKLLYETCLKESTIPLSRTCKVDGGVSNNDFLVQMVADLTNSCVDRPQHVDMASLGSAFLAGLGMGVWQNKEELRKLRVVEKTFLPRDNFDKYKDNITDWERAVKRAMNWYNQPMGVEKKTKMETA